MIRLYTGGTFDLFHAGHVNLLKACHDMADELIVALNSDRFIKKFKFKEPILPYEERKLILESCRYVDSVIMHDNDFNSTETIDSVCNVNIIAVGDDWKSKNYYQQMGFTDAWLEERNIKLIYLPYGNLMNTTKIKNKVYSQFQS
jgi:glycerol-3-phosphate cytidylyltransferase